MSRYRIRGKYTNDLSVAISLADALKQNHRMIKNKIYGLIINKMDMKVKDPNRFKYQSGPIFSLDQYHFENFMWKTSREPSTFITRGASNLSFVDYKYTRYNHLCDYMNFYMNDIRGNTHELMLMPGDSIDYDIVFLSMK